MIKTYLKNIHAIVAGVMALLLFLMALAWILSPRIYASSIESAVRTGNLGVLASRIGAVGRTLTAEDTLELIPAGFRLASGVPINDDLRKKINASVKDSTAGVDPAFIEKMGNFLAGKGMVTQSVISEIPKSLLAVRAPDFNGESGDTVDVYVLRVVFQQTGEQIALTLERKGWFTWRVAKMSSSGGSVFWPVRGSNS